jgi:putative transcriptional regulator
MPKQYMSDQNFQELLEGVREMKAIQRGELQPARTTTLEDTDAKSARESLGLSQSEFAAVLGISKRTLEGWEQRRRQPTGAARILLKVAMKHPKAVLEVVAGNRKVSRAQMPRARV